MAASATPWATTIIGVRASRPNGNRRVGPAATACAIRSDNPAIPIPINAYAPSNRMIRAPLSTPHTTARPPHTADATIEPVSAARSPAVAAGAVRAASCCAPVPALGPSGPAA